MSIAVAVWVTFQPFFSSWCSRKSFSDSSWNSRRVCSDKSDSAIGGWALGAANRLEGTLVSLVLMMTGPAIAALVCAFAFEKGRRLDMLGLRGPPNLWWFLAYLIALALGAASVLLTLMLFTTWSRETLVLKAKELVAALFFAGMAFALFKYAAHAKDQPPK